MQNYNRQSYERPKAQSGQYENNSDAKFGESQLQPNYLINVISEENQPNPKQDPLKEAQSELDPKLELMFNRIQYFQQQVINYDTQNTSLKDQMNIEIERNKKVEDAVNESIVGVNEDLNNLNQVIESIAEKKAFLDKAISQIKLAKLIQMENEFLKGENKQLKSKIDDLYTVISDFEQSEQELLQSQENLKKDMKDVIESNLFIKNNYSATQSSHTQVEQQLLMLKSQHNKLLLDYEIIERENKRFKEKEKERESYRMSQRNSQISKIDMEGNLLQIKENGNKKENNEKSQQYLKDFEEKLIGNLIN